MSKKKKNKIVPRTSANENSINHAKYLKHKSEVIQKKIEKMMQEERERRMAMDTGATSTATVNTDKKNDISSETI